MMPAGAPTIPSAVCSGGPRPISPACGTPRGVRSVIPDPRVQDAVEDIRDQVEQDDDDGGDDEVRHDRVQIERLEPLHEEVADSVEAEDRLGDDCASEQPA